MSSKKIVQASFVTPGIEKNLKRGKVFFFGPMNIFFKFFLKKQKKMVCLLFQYPKRHNISLTLPKQKETSKSKFKKSKIMTIPEISGLIFFLS